MSATVNVWPDSQDPYSTRWLKSSGWAVIEIGDTSIFVCTPEQADSLIRAAVAAKDLLIAATTEAVAP